MMDMMAWRAEEEHVLHQITDPWRVSSLIRALFDLIFTLCVFLCAIIFVMTTRLIKSSGLLNQTCGSCDMRDHNHQSQSRLGKDLKGHQKLADFCDVQRNGCNYVGRCRGCPRLPINIICKNCTYALADCACPLKRGTSVVDDDSFPVRFRCHCVTSDKNINNNNPVHYCGSDHTIGWAVDDDTDNYGRNQPRGGSCSSLFENVNSSCDDGNSERIASDTTTVPAAYGCECRSCMGIPPAGGCLSPTRKGVRRAVKRKFAKVFPNDYTNMARAGGASCSSCCRDHHSANVCADSASLIISEGGPAEIRESEGDSNDDGLQLVHNDDGISSRFPSDGSAGQNATRVCPENSARDSCHEGFSYNSSNRSRSPQGGSSCCADVSRNRLKLSIDADVLTGESSTPEWCVSSASPSLFPAVGNEKEMDIEEDEMEAGSTLEPAQDSDIAVMEIREALDEEREALAALYLELEEERNAAGSAAHEAMAMITRLQEEKAAIQMDARQYQRMSEEKQQYDQESMAMLQEILVKKDEEVYALEEEVNKYRERLLNLGMEELMDRSTGVREGAGSPKSGEVVLIERETLLVEGSEDWQNRRDKRDEKLLAEIKDWLQEASEKVIVAPERIEELNVLRRNLPKIAGNINRLLPGNGKKNLFELFSAVAVPETDGIIAMEDVQRDGIVNEEFETDRIVAMEGIQRDGLVNEEFEAHRDRVTNADYEAHREETTIEEVGTNNADSAAGYESFQGMMESLRREPSMKDEESLETLKEIEEKFRKQSSEGEVRRSADELRQIWKSTLRSFESDEREDPEARQVEGEAESSHSLTTAVEPADTSDSAHHHAEVTDTAVDADRSIGEKRISVLEYVWKFEEQLHQLGNKKPPPQPSKSVLSTIVESVAETPPASNGESSESMDSDKSKNSTSGGDRPVIPIKTRLRKRRAADNRNASPEAERDRFVVRGEGFPSSERATRNPDVRFVKSSNFEESNQDRSSIVHDVYEVQRDPKETNTEVPSSEFRKDERFSHDIKKCVSFTGNDLVRGHFIDSHETAHCVEQYLSDDGRPDFDAGHTLEEHEAHGKGRPDHDCSTAPVSLSVKMPGMCMQATAIFPREYMDVFRESDGCALKAPSSVVTDSPKTQMQDVVQQLTNRLQALETDRQILQDTIASLKKENGEMKVLQDIAQQLTELRGMEQTAMTNTNMWLADVSSIKGMLSWDRLRHSVQSQLSKLVQRFLANGEPGGFQEYQQVGLFRLLHKAPLSNQQRPIESVRSSKAVQAANGSVSDDQVQPSIVTLNPLVSQYSWPMSAKERSDTAFSGWDY
ncbi:unnamed protein product [Calypogeia fissa]